MRPGYISFPNLKEIFLSGIFFSDRDDLRSFYIRCLVSLGNDSPWGSHFCMSCEQRRWLSFVMDNLSKSGGDQPKDSASLLSKVQPCLLSSIIKITSASRERGRDFLYPLKKILSAQDSSLVMQRIIHAGVICPSSRGLRIGNWGLRNWHK